MKRSTPPTVIMGCGFAAVVIMGLVVSHVSDVHPIMKLKPMLEKKYGKRGFSCWLKLEDRKIEVQPPAELALDQLERRRLGAVAFNEYLELTKFQTQVEYVAVLPPRGAPAGTQTEEVSRVATESASAAEHMTGQIVADASIAAGTTLTVASVAPGRDGAIVVLAGARDEAEARRAAQKTAKIPGISLARASAGGVTIEAGAEAGRFASIAPVRT